MKNDSLKGQHQIMSKSVPEEVRIVGDEVEPELLSDSSGLENGRGNGSRSRGDYSNAQPPVCRSIDYSKFLYQLKSRRRSRLR